MIPLTQGCAKNLIRLAVPGCGALLVCGQAIAGGPGTARYDSGPISALKPVTGPTAIDTKAGLDLYVGHGDVPEKVRLCFDIINFGPQKPGDRPVIGNPLGDTFNAPPVDDKPTWDEKPKYGNSGGAPTPTPGTAALLAIGLTATAGRRRRR